MTETNDRGYGYTSKEPQAHDLPCKFLDFQARPLGSADPCRPDGEPAEFSESVISKTCCKTHRRQIRGQAPQNPRNRAIDAVMPFARRGQTPQACHARTRNVEHFARKLRGTHYISEKQAQNSSASMQQFDRHAEPP